MEHPDNTNLARIYRAETLRAILARCPRMQAQAVVDYHNRTHYVVEELTQALKWRDGNSLRGMASSKILDEFIDMLRKQLADAHYDILGLPLEWPINNNESFGPNIDGPLHPAQGEVAGADRIQEQAGPIQNECIPDASYGEAGGAGKGLGR